ncbi:MAG TPA: FIST N-terminal domain-containing protein [Nannocystaceae bacterium]|nr:FIST N-terminal domain-containing protein [Nannocystaceae bacterium]
MQWVSKVSTAASFVDALAETVAGIHAHLDGSAPSLVFAFASPHHREHFVRAPGELTDAFPGAVVFGCSGAGIVGDGRELERTPALSLTGAVLPAVELSTFHVEADDLPGADDPEAWHARLGLAGDASGGLVVLADPFTCDGGPLLQSLDRAFPTLVKIGGLASGGNQPGETALFSGASTFGSGAIGLAMTGNIVVDALVAQGCRPIGTPMFVTRSERNVIHELDGRPVARVLQEVYEQAAPRDRELMRSSLFLGLVTRPDQQVYRQGDFLVRNILGLDARTGALAVAAEAAKNGVVQFHLRDADTSSEDLGVVLRGYAEHGHRPAGALMFSCLGRGQGLYGRPNHDVDALREHLGDVAAGGFFCNGEIGPVGGRTHLHGYTTSFGLFRRAHSD